jgi:hypothetical protein
MPGDLVGGRYPVMYPFAKMLGLQANSSQGNISVRSNVEGPFALNAAADTGAALTTAVGHAVPVPVEVGDVISKVSVRTGATAAVTPTNSWAALYAGQSGATAPTLISQTADRLTAAIAATTTFQWTFATPYTVQPADCPNGYIYVSVMVKAGTVPSLATVAVPAAALTADTTHPWFTGAPIWAQSHGSALAATAPATITGGTVLAAAVAVFLS